eukprot:1437534-Rhodomonas_salina.1
MALPVSRGGAEGCRGGPAISLRAISLRAISLRAISLRACYAMSATDLACGAPRRRLRGCGLKRRSSRSASLSSYALLRAVRREGKGLEKRLGRSLGCYARARRSPVLRYGMVVPAALRGAQRAEEEARKKEREELRAREREVEREVGAQRERCVRVARPIVLRARCTFSRYRHTPFLRAVRPYKQRGQTARRSVERSPSPLSPYALARRCPAERVARESALNEVKEEARKLKGALRKVLSLARLLRARYAVSGTEIDDVLAAGAGGGGEREGGVGGGEGAVEGGGGRGGGGEGAGAEAEREGGAEAARVVRVSSPSPAPLYRPTRCLVLTCGSFVAVCYVLSACGTEIESWCYAASKRVVVSEGQAYAATEISHREIGDPAAINAETAMQRPLSETERPLAETERPLAETERPKGELKEALWSERTRNEGRRRQEAAVCAPLLPDARPLSSYALPTQCPRSSYALLVLCTRYAVPAIVLHVPYAVPSNVLRTPRTEGKLYAPPPTPLRMTPYFTTLCITPVVLCSPYACGMHALLFPDKLPTESPLSSYTLPTRFPPIFLHVPYAVPAIVLRSPCLCAYAVPAMCGTELRVHTGVRRAGLRGR